MKKHYWVRRGDFANQYTLGYTETAEQEEWAEQAGCERITRKEAEQLCRDERYRERHDSAFSGYADSVILPVWYPADRDWRDDPKCTLCGYIVERRRAYDAV